MSEISIFCLAIQISSMIGLGCNSIRLNYTERKDIRTPITNTTKKSEVFFWHFPDYRGSRVITIPSHYPLILSAFVSKAKTQSWDTALQVNKVSLKSYLRHCDLHIFHINLHQDPWQTVRGISNSKLLHLVGKVFDESSIKNNNSGTCVSDGWLKQTCDQKGCKLESLIPRCSTGAAQQQQQQQHDKPEVNPPGSSFLHLPHNNHPHHSNNNNHFSHLCI